MNKKEKKFEYNGKQYLIKKLTYSQSIDAHKVYTKAFKSYVDNGSMLRKSLEDHMVKQGLWTEEHTKEYESIIRETADIEYQIKTGQFTKASELRQKALDLKLLRSKMTSLLSIKSSMDSVTADGMADNDKFNYELVISLYDYITQKPVFSSVEEYKQMADSDKEEDSNFALKCATEYANFSYGLDDDFENSFLENKLLKRLNLLNDKGQLVNRDGKRVDFEGNLLDENGARIDKDGNRIDINNNLLVDDDIVESLEFEDDLILMDNEKDKPKKKTNTSVKKQTEAI